MPMRRAADSGRGSGADRWGAAQVNARHLTREKASSVQLPSGGSDVDGPFF